MYLYDLVSAAKARKPGWIDESPAGPLTRGQRSDRLPSPRCSDTADLLHLPLGPQPPKLNRARDRVRRGQLQIIRRKP